MISDTEEPKRPEPKKNGNGNGKCLGTLKEFFTARLSGGGCKVALFSHPFPDPDAIASMMGLAWLLDKVFEADVKLFIMGDVSHPQNNIFVNLLAPKLIPVEECCPNDYEMRILLDVIPSNAGVADKVIAFDAVIDHHVEQVTSEYQGLFVNMHTGSCVATIYSLIKSFGLSFEEENDADQLVATAMMVGIATDTCNQMADRTTEYDHEAYKELFPYRDPIALQKIVKYKVPRSWAVKLGEAMDDIEQKTQEGVAVVGVGLLSCKQRDLIAYIADNLLSLEGVDTAVVFAIIDGIGLQGSVRTDTSSVSAAKLCSDLGKERGGAGWGHARMAGYRFNLGGMAIDANDNEDIQEMTWLLAEKREVERIKRLIKK
jgi:nanoRNase/pAp phosphatase (c-di-AMP/oligoRNAs hydrolase)